MGYKDERASLNQVSELYKYCKESVFDKITLAFKASKALEDESASDELPFMYVSENREDSTPVASFDGGLATIFPGELAETRIIKVCGACPPKWETSFGSSLSSTLFYVLNGMLKWPKGANLSEEELINLTLDESLKVEAITEALDHLGIDIENYKVFMADLLRFKKGDQVDDCFRELLEWCLIINFSERQKKNKLINFEKSVPYLIVKDGSLYPHSKTLSKEMAEAIKSWLNSGDVPIIGMVKSSRFVAEDSAYRKSINKYIRRVKSNAFFQLPKKVELKMDAKEYEYERFFLALFSASNVYEVQIPKVLISKNPLNREIIMDILSSQVTFKFGGAISTNSFAHIQASLAESEARMLTERLRNELKESLRGKK